MNYTILVINPGSTSTKIAIYKNSTEFVEKTIQHSIEELALFKRVSSQFEFRKKIILETINEFDINLDEIDVVVSRGGVLKPISGGTYKVNEKMLLDLKNDIGGEHASNLGGRIAHDIASKIFKKAYIVDPVVVDELDDIARVSGIPEIERKSIFHALNQKAMGRRAATEMNRSYEDLNLIVVHMGGGISVGAHSKGRVIDVNNALNGDGPFSPERSGQLPVQDLINLFIKKKYDIEFINRRIVGNGGVVAYLNSNNMKLVTDNLESGDKKSKLIVDAMVYQIAKEVGAMAAVLSGKVDSIILTGGIAYSKYIIDELISRISFIGDIKIYPGENEMLALAQGVLRVLEEKEKVKTY